MFLKEENYLNIKANFTFLDAVIDKKHKCLIDC